MDIKNLLCYLNKKRNNETNNIKRVAYENVINHLTTYIQYNFYNKEKINGNLISKIAYCSYLQREYKENPGVSYFYTEVINICNFCLSNLF